jgi:hypothetical protein
MFGWFTRKNPLSSKGYNSLNKNISEYNPMYDDDREVLVSKLIQGYKKHNISVFNKTIPPLRNYLKKNPQFAPQFLESRFNRSQSDLSDVSDEDIEDMKYQLTRSNIGGRRKTRKRKSRKSRSS